MKSIKNKICIFVISIIILNSNLVLAGTETEIIESKNKLNQYVESEWDFLGHRGESLYFKLRNNYAKGDILKELDFDIKMRKEVYTSSKKIVDDNDLVYGTIGVLYGLKTNIPRTEKTDKAVIHLLKRMLNF